MPFLTYKNIQIHYTSQGSGSVVVLLHGFLESSTMWEQVMPTLTQKHRVIAIDLLGHGQTESLAYVHTMEEQATLVNSVLKTLKVQKYVLIGHSMGAYIALALAAENSVNLSHLVLMNSTSLPDSKTRLLNRDRAIKMIKQNKDSFIKMAIPNLFSEASRTLYKEAINALKIEAQQMTVQGIVAAIEGMKIRKNQSDLLQTTAFPITFIAGKKDTVLDYDSLLEETKNTKVNFIALANGHMSHIEDTKALKDILAAL